MIIRRFIALLVLFIGILVFSILMIPFILIWILTGKNYCTGYYMGLFDIVENIARTNF